VPLYAAYASNLDPLRMFERCPHSPARGTGWLVGWRLTFAGEELGWDGALATIAEDPGSQVFVALYDVSREDERLLKGWEIDAYRKLHVRVQTLDGEQLAWVYVLDAYEGGLPSASYVGVISEAAAAAGAPDDYVDDLRNRPCRSIGG
jgi:AIG2 family protein